MRTLKNSYLTYTTGNKCFSTLFVTVLLIIFASGCAHARTGASGDAATGMDGQATQLDLNDVIGNQDQTRSQAINQLIEQHKDNPKIEIFESFASLLFDTHEDVEIRSLALNGMEWFVINEPAFMDGVVQQMVQLILDTKEESEIRIAASQFVARAGARADDFIPSILKSLEEIEEEARWHLSALIYDRAREDDGIINELIEILEGERDEEVKGYAVRLLSSLEERAAGSAELLRQIVRQSNDSELRFAAARGLIQTGAETPDDSHVFEDLLNSDDEDLRHLAARFLGLGTTVARRERTLAFPTAEGFGAYTRGGRGGKVYVVDNLNDSGPGSFREAVEAEGPRIVVFKVSGVIELESRLDITSPYITIAGQSAPGEGITIISNPTRISADEVILRHMRFRLGDKHPDIQSDALRASSGNGHENIIIDHITASWGSEQTATFYRNYNFTLQWSIVSESIYNGRGFAGIWGGRGSFHHNLIAHHRSRTPRFAGRLNDPILDYVDFRNNVIYNWGSPGLYGGERGVYNMVGNYFKPGPAEGPIRFARPNSYRAYWYFEGNYMEGYPALNEDNWKGVEISEFFETDDLDRIPAKRPFHYAPVETHSAHEAFELVLEKVGASLPRRDAIDRRIIEETRNGTATYGGVYGDGSGIIDSQEQVGGYPEISRFVSAMDSNNNGIPDWWSISYGFSPDYLDVNEDLDLDGYTIIEEYVNGTDPDKSNR
jgi:hypothetical protein